ncbi:uncharacterized protein (DUF849 family) [Rhizobium sp. BK316]|uniref:3-keto-5-aminohexanoate cleavage protein n=1 Tax=Rhizobium sp. BK316 TaxID=2587053 RepID=UPI00161412A5|nr:3-keto-5-aminohexanoate cleavage protein [Rhizobium sp. BK316]MBB3407578.1 uncharacterized protein (DUF849 family) [Rhizobium sp. BK316]
MQDLAAPADCRRGIALAIAPNGGRRTKADHPALPIGPSELAECAQACLEAGASMIHVHVRDDAGQHCLEIDRYQATEQAIRQRVGEQLIVQVTTEALGRYTPQQQSDLVRVLRPQACSMALREIAPDVPHEVAFASLLEWMRRERIFPQIILYDAVDVARLQDMRLRGVIPADDIPVLFVLGRYTASQQSHPADLDEFLGVTRQAPFSHWTVCAFGRDEAACAVTAALRGGHARLGFENNLFLPDGTVASDNAALVAPVANALRGLGRSLETAESQRASLEAIW